MVAPNTIQLVVKTHSIAIYLATPLAALLSDLKADTFSALSQFHDVDDIPPISSEEDFELCRKEVPTTGPRGGGGGGGGTTKYVMLEGGSNTVRQQGLVNWQVLYLRIRVDGRLQDVEVTEPRLDDEDEDTVPPPDLKGKQKAGGL